MNNKAFRIILYTVITLCVILTAAHAAYAVYAYSHSSIIYFIAKELW